MLMLIVYRELIKQQFGDLNTSNVNVNLYYTDGSMAYETNLNTSNVNVNHSINNSI